MNNAGDGYLPPPPPQNLRSPGSAGSEHFPSPTAVPPAPPPQRRIGLVPPPPRITTAFAGPGGRSPASASPYAYPSPVTSIHSALSPHVSVASPSLLSPRTAENDMAYRSASGGMEYNPQQWGRGGSTVGQYRPHATLTVPPPAPRMLDDSGQPLESPPPPYTPNAQSSSSSSMSQSMNQALDPRTPPQLQTNIRTPASNLVNDINTPTSAVTVISPMIRSRNEVPMAFAPPPNANRDRSSSRSRFGFSALTRGRSTDRSNVSPPPSTNAIDNLQYSTREALANAPVHRWDSPQPRQQGHVSNRSTVYIPNPQDVAPQLAPPAARRSASAGAMSHHHWAPGMPLPPPPGPPPSNSRSVSMSRASPDLQHAIPVPPSDPSTANVPIISAPTRRPPPHRGTQLGPVPPTPAGYSEFPQSPMPPQMRNPSPASSSTQALSNNTTPQSTDIMSPMDREPQRTLSGTSWSGSGSGSSRRESSVKGIRERRSESRAARDRLPENADEGPSSRAPSPKQVGPADLVLSPVSSNGRITRMGALKKPRISPIDHGRVAPAMRSPLRSGETATPPFSPATEAKGPFARSSPMPPKSLPTPPPQSSLAIKSPPAQTLAIPDSAKSMPTTANTIPPGSATRSSSNNSAWQPESGDSFAIQSIRRHQDFIRKESSCRSDADRLKLFAEYIVAESRLRRDQYSAAFAEMEPADVMDLTRDLWRKMQPTPTSVPRPASAVPSSASSMPPATRTDSMNSFMSMSSPISGSQANFTPLTEPESPASVTSSAGARDCGPWARHQPVLSPIPSMAMSTVPDPDEEDSRGRPASRWWESSAGSTGASQRIERTKRESKFMGVHREALASLQWQDEPSPSMHGGTPRTIGGDYPPEKVGWHDDGGQGPASTPRYFQSVAQTPDVNKMDVSRLVTLPPPYPRHYPAMSNNHPDLVSIRTELEHLRELDVIKQTKDNFNAKLAQRRERVAREAADRRSQMHRNIQEQLSLGQMNFAQAAAAEEDFNASEARAGQAAVRKNYDSFAPEVMTPLHAMISEKITRGNACIAQLCSGLRTSANNPSPNQPEEEGDDQPELLEKLNLLKWLLDAREALHKALDDLEGERNELYREVIVKPLRDSGDEAKLNGANQFFDQDRQERNTAYEKDASKRYEEFASIIEKNVTRGVEEQLGAFWDIAPGLSSVVQKLPDDLASPTFDLHIPPSEYDENPQFEQHPLQYLYMLLTHAEKSAYQFIESQVNLMCLLHEAHSGLMVIGIRLMESQRVQDGENGDRVKAEMGEVRRAEEQRLTVELKEKVETVESQWREGLGSSLEAVKERVRDHLESTGGWEEALLE